MVVILKGLYIFTSGPPPELPEPKMGPAEPTPPVSQAPVPVPDAPPAAGPARRERQPRPAPYSCPFTEAQARAATVRTRSQVRAVGGQLARPSKPKTDTIFRNRLYFI